MLTSPVWQGWDWADHCSSPASFAFVKQKPICWTKCPKCSTAVWACCLFWGESDQVDSLAPRILLISCFSAAWRLHSGDIFTLWSALSPFRFLLVHSSGWLCCLRGNALCLVMSCQATVCLALCRPEAAWYKTSMRKSTRTKKTKKIIPQYT